MKNHGFVKVAAAVPFIKVAGISHNCEQIISMIKVVCSNKASVVVFPELCITGYTCGDLFQQSTIINESLKGLAEIAAKTEDLQILVIVGLPVINNNKLFNCAAILNKGKILGIIPKSYIPGYKEFYEPRWFSGINAEYDDSVHIFGQTVPFGTNLLFQDINNNHICVGVEICEDLWVPVPPSCNHTIAGATIICNLSASNVLIGKKEYRRDLIKNQSGRCLCGYIYSSAGMGESTTDVVFDADACIAENAVVLAESERFIRKNQIIYSEIDVEKLISERIKMNSFENTGFIYQRIPFEGSSETLSLSRVIDPHPFVPKDKAKFDLRCQEIFNIQAAGLAKRLESIPGCKAIIGVSGGLDSTLALLVTAKTFNILNKPLSDIIAITMPGFGTTDRTYNNAVKLCNLLGAEFKELDIKDISNVMFQKIGLDSSKADITYENIQARARTYLLMTIANQGNGIVIGTGDLSEIALGWSTYNGDHMSMYNVNSGIPKTLVKFLVNWVGETQFDRKLFDLLHDITIQPISPELLPTDGKKVTQLTEDKIGPYELHDFFLYHFVRFGFTAKKILFLAQEAFKTKYDNDTIKMWLIVFFKRFFSSQWKRDCVPGGVKVGSIDLSPRGSWRMPSEANIEDFIKSFE
jgi:NAD+ synthase (glutamine-hydrolysing)